MVFVRLAGMGYIDADVFNVPWGNLAFFVLSYACHFQFPSHAGIAINRFHVLTDACTPRKQLTVIAIHVLSLPPALMRLISHVKLVATKDPSVYVVVRDLSWVNTGAPITVVAYSLGTSIVSILFEVSSAIVYKRLTATAKKKYRNDFLLLIYAFLQFFIQAAISFYYALSAYGTLIGDVALASIGLLATTFLGLAICFSPPVCLFSMSKSLRSAYFEMFCQRARATAVSFHPKNGVQRNIAATPARTQ